MRTTGPAPKRALPRTKLSRLPIWMGVSLAVALGVLVYGILTPSPPSAFDLPQAQSPDGARSPWIAPRPL